MKKMTKIQKFEMLAQLADVKANPILSEFVAHEMELLAKKTEDKKPTAKQAENASIQSAILEAMESGKRYTITDMMKQIPACAELTNQRVAAIIRPLIDVSIERIVEKRVAYFQKKEA